MIRALFRRGPALLSREAGGERWLMVVVAVLCFLASITAVGAVAANRAAHGWAHQLRGEATVQVRPRVDETGPTAAARAAETLAGVKGVAEAEAMDRKAAEALLRPWVGEAALPDLPLPYLVTVRLDPKAPASAPTLSRALAEAGLDATVDDHSLWRGEVERSAGVITAQAGAVGAGVAALLLALLRLIGGEGGLTPALPLAFSDLVVLAACPALAFGVALLAARFTALAKLGGRG